MFTRHAGSISWQDAVRVCLQCCKDVNGRLRWEGVVLRVAGRLSFIRGRALISTPTNAKRMCELASSQSISITECHLIGQRA